MGISILSESSVSAVTMNTYSDVSEITRCEHVDFQRVMMLPKFRKQTTFISPVEIEASPSATVYRRHLTHDSEVTVWTLSVPTSERESVYSSNNSDSDCSTVRVPLPKERNNLAVGDDSCKNDMISIPSFYSASSSEMSDLSDAEDGIFIRRQTSSRKPAVERWMFNHFRPSSASLGTMSDATDGYYSPDMSRQSTAAKGKPIQIFRSPLQARYNHCGKVFEMMTQEN